MTEQEKIGIRVLMKSKVDTYNGYLNYLYDETTLMTPEKLFWLSDKDCMKELKSDDLRKWAIEATERKLIKLLDALAKFDYKEFGKCVSCGREIPTSQLYEAPENNECRNCINMCKTL